MRLRIFMLVGLALTLVGCADSEPTEIAPPELTTVADLDAAVRTAAAALLEQEIIPVAVVAFAWDDPERITRYEWIDYRPAGEVLAVNRDLEDQTTTAVSRANEMWTEARISAADTYPWQSESSLTTIPETVPTIGDLIAMTTQETPEFTERDPAVRHQATVQRASDGSELWTLVIPDAASAVVATRQWILNPGGLLQFHRISANDRSFSPEEQTVIYEYGIEEEDDELAPIIVPELGTDLVLDELGLPNSLRDIE
jgi:hypothetical protein